MECLEPKEVEEAEPMDQEPPTVELTDEEKKRREEQEVLVRFD